MQQDNQPEETPDSETPSSPATALGEIERTLLQQLLVLPGPSGEEAHIAAFVAGYAEETVPGVRVIRIQDNVIALRGEPKTAIFAHLDTIGFTLGYGSKLLPIGSPHAEDKNALRCTEPRSLSGRFRLPGGGSRGKKRDRDSKDKGAGPRLRNIEGGEAEPGTRWVYAAEPVFNNKKGIVTSPYLDNRAGVWAALQALSRCENIAVAFTVGEEQHGHGARVCADRLYRDHGVTQALIADLTWDTKDTPIGKGVVVSLRDSTSPRQSYLHRVLTLAAQSGIRYQREVQSAGGSDGTHIQRSSIPMDWVFVGAPEKRPHTAREQASYADLQAMTELLAYLVDKL